MARLYDLLPLVIRMRDEEASGSGGIKPILQRITETLLQEEFDAHSAAVTQLRQLYNCLTTENPYRGLLLRMLGQKIADGWAEQLERFFLCEAIPWHQISGTRFGWWKSLEYRAAGAYDFYELYKTELNEIADYAPSQNTMFPFRAARVALTPQGLSPYDWSTDTIICVPPYIPSDDDGDTVVEVDYDVGTTDLASELVAHWNLNEPIGQDRKPTVGDESLYFRDNGSLAVGSALGIDRYAAKWDDPTLAQTESFPPPDTGERLELNNPVVNFATGESFTIHFWMNLREAYKGQSRILFFKQDSVNSGNADPDAQSSYHLKTIEANGHFNLEFVVNDAFGNQASIRTPLSQTLIPDKFYSVICWYDARDGKAYIQINDFQFNRSNQIAVGGAGGVGPLVLGNGSDTIQQFRGLEDALSIWTRVLTFSERTQLFENQGSDPTGNFPESEDFLSFHQKIVSPRRALDQRFAGSRNVEVSNGWLFLSDPLETLSEEGTDDITDPDIVVSTAGRVYAYKKLTNSVDSWEVDQDIRPIMPTTNGRFGASIAALKNWLFIGAVDMVHVFRREYVVRESGAAARETWVWYETIPKPNDEARNFGIGPMDADTDTLVVGDDTAAVDDVANRGRVHVYTWNGKTWQADHQSLLPTGINSHNEGDNFGADVSISGNTIVVGSPNHHYDIRGWDRMTNAGAAFSYVKTGATWGQHQKITARLRHVDSRFGSSVVVDSGLLIIGADGEARDAKDENWIPGAGAAYVFETSTLPYGDVFLDPGETLEFREVQKLVASDRQDAGVAAQFGKTLTLDGDILVVGAPFDSFDENGETFFNSSGAAYVYTLMYAYNAAFHENQKIVGAGPNGRKAGDFFGISLSMERGVLAVGAPGQNYDQDGGNYIEDGVTEGPGAAYVFGTTVFTPTPPPGSEDFDVVVCQDFAVFPVGFIDTVWGANDATSVTVAGSLLPPQTVELPPPTFKGPFDLILIRFRARSTAGMPVNLRLNMPMSSEDRSAFVSETLAEYEVSWEGSWDSIDWADFWISLATGKEIWTIELTAIELVVRQSSQVVSTGGGGDGGAETTGQPGVFGDTCLSDELLRHGSIQDLIDDDLIPPNGPYNPPERFEVGEWIPYSQNNNTQPVEVDSRGFKVNAPSYEGYQGMYVPLTGLTPGHGVKINIRYAGAGFPAGDNDKPYQLSWIVLFKDDPANLGEGAEGAENILGYVNWNPSTLIRPGDEIELKAGNIPPSGEVKLGVFSVRVGGGGGGFYYFDQITACEVAGEGSGGGNLKTLEVPLPRFGRETNEFWYGTAKNWPEENFLNSVFPEDQGYWTIDPNYPFSRTLAGAGFEYDIFSTPPAPAGGALGPGIDIRVHSVVTWPLVNLPRGAVVKSAKLVGFERFDWDIENSGPINISIRGVLAVQEDLIDLSSVDDGGGSFLSLATRVLGPLTTARTRWDLTASSVDSNPFTPETSPDITRIIQEIIDLDKWAENKSGFHNTSLRLLIEDNGTVYDSSSADPRPNPRVAEFASATGTSGSQEPLTLVIEYEDTGADDDNDDGTTAGSDSCLQACECMCQSGCEVACQVAGETTTCITQCENQCQTICQDGVQPGQFSLPPDQDTEPCLQFELEGCIEINDCLGNVVPFMQAMDIINEFLHDQRPIHVLPVYCVTEFDFTEQVCGPGEDLFGKVIGKFSDQVPPIGDSLGITPDCTQGCQVSCETFCEVGCEDNCQGIGACENSCQLNCEANCQIDCEVVCQAGCVISCQADACQNFCQGICQSSCQIACENLCQGACEIAGCQLSCTSGCEDNCELDCQISCELECQSPAEQACQTSCQEFCQVCCQEACEGIGCQTTCELVCQASCVSGCEEACETNCQSACEGGCQSQCEFNCQADCEGAGCEVSCEGGCEGGCEGQCEVTCEGASCQAACEDSGCQSCCECQCQSSGCEESCTSGCTEGCQTGCEADCQDSGGCETSCEQSCEGSSEACTDCCEVCCEEYTEYAQCQSDCETGGCEGASCQVNCQLDTEAIDPCVTTCQTPCTLGTCQMGCQAASEGCQLFTETCGAIEGIA